jgi:hypothetical protein
MIIALEKFIAFIRRENFEADIFYSSFASWLRYIEV